MPLTSRLLATDDFWQNGELVDKYDSTHQVAMLYVSDHGESWAKTAFIGHGMPYKIAPKSAKHVASMFWAGKHLRAFKQCHLILNSPMMPLPQLC